MKHIFKTIKKYTVAIILTFILLFIQANCDLELPDYTSKIINIGIQQNGIDSKALSSISKKSFDNLLLFMNEYEQNVMKDSYSLNDNYQLNNVNKETKKEIEKIITIPSVIVYQLSNEETSGQLFDYQLPVGTTIFDFLHNLSGEELEKINIDIKEKFKNTEESLLNQMSFMFARDEYKIVNVDLNKLQMNYISVVGIKMLSLALLSMIIAVLTTLIISKVASSLGKNLRSKVVTKVMSYSNAEFNEFSSSSLITRSTNDIQQIQMLIVMLVRIVFYAPIIALGALSKVSNNDMSWVIGLGVMVIISIVIVLFVIAMPKFQIVQKMIDKLNSISREILTGNQVIRAFANEKHEEQRFDKANKDLTKVNLFVNKVMTVMMPLMTFVMNAVCILIIWVGASKIDMGSIQVGTLMAFITYTMQIIMAFLMISMVSIMVPRAIVSMKRIGEVLNKDSSVKDKEITKEFESNKCVEFKDVYFRYPDAEEDILENISFKAFPNTTTAFIGSTGSGKSTLVNLIPRFFDVTGGKVLVNGVNIKDVKLSDLRKEIGYVPQKGMLFTGDIKSNIGFGVDNIDEENLIKAARISQSTEFIKNKKEKYETSIAQGGTNVSGGQRQRLAIARAIATNPSIYIFDDSFSALDYKTDSKLRASLASSTENCIIFIVAQRISTVLNADQIIVLEDGKMVGCGNHKELLKNCEVYKEIASSQLSKEELANE